MSKLVQPQLLSKFELCLYSIFWVSCLLYASYNVFFAGKLFDTSESGDGFENGWFFGYKKDVGDYEWHVWLQIFLSLMPWYFVHIILTEFTRWTLIEALPLCHILVTNLILCNIFGIKVVLFIFIKILLYYVILKIRSRLLIWILTGSSLLLLSTGITNVFTFLEVPHSSQYYIAATFAWLQLKCASFSFEFLNDSSAKLNLFTLLSLLGYSYYLPLYFLGPLMLYNEYEKGVKQKFRPWTLRRIVFSVLSILRYIIWLLLLDLFLHFFYIYALEYNILKVKQFGAWYVNGLGYLLGVFFCIKYTAVYGLTRTLASIESYNPPPAPSCCFYVYRNSQMWRKFDVGFYQFIKRYIYNPILNESKSLSKGLFAASITFSYVFLWHGTRTYVFIWSFLNFVEVAIIESAISRISRNETFRNFVINNISKKNTVRLAGMIYGPLYLFFLVANSFFYSPEGGYVFLAQFLEGDWLLIIVTNAICYAFCITAMYINDYQERTRIKSDCILNVKAM